MSATTTAAPLAAKAVAIARPMPLAAPVTNCHLAAEIAFHRQSSDWIRCTVMCRTTIRATLRQDQSSLLYPCRSEPENRTPAYQPKRREANARPAAIALRGRRLNRGGGPLYKQLLAILRDSIVSGSPPVGTPLPARSRPRGKLSGQPDHRAAGAARSRGGGAHPKRAAKPAIVADPSARMNPTFDFRTFGDIAAFTAQRQTGGRQLPQGARRRSRPASSGCRHARQVHVLRGVLVSGGPTRGRDHDLFSARDRASGSRAAAFDDALIFRSVEKHLGHQDGGGATHGPGGDGRCAACAQTRLRRGRGGSHDGDPLPHRLTAQPAELTVARHRADLFSLSYDVPNEALRRPEQK